MAVAPSSCRFYTRNEQRNKVDKKSQHMVQTEERPLDRHVSEKHVRPDCVTHSGMFSPSSAALVYHPGKPPRA